MKTKIDIFSGFLGAGKTFLIKKLIKEELYKDRTVIIENEFGEVSIDGAFLKEVNMKVMEINAGCICCSVAGDFKKALAEVLPKYSPSRIIIEPSGVAKLSELISSTSVMEKEWPIELNILATVVDAAKYHYYSLNFGDFYLDQISSAKTIILSRTQDISRAKLQSLVEELRVHNSNASIITTPWDKLSGVNILKAAEEDFKRFLSEQLKGFRNISRSSLASARIGESQHSLKAKDVFQAWGIETSKRYSRERIKDILKAISVQMSYGVVLRAKGIVQSESEAWLEFDFVSGEYEIRNSIASPCGRLCVIGSNLNVINLKELFGAGEGMVL